ncbi:U2AF65A, partial [Symbiodinium sp. CCMP2456]
MGRHAWLLIALTRQVWAGVWSSSPAPCHDDESCKARLDTITSKLDELRDEMRGKHLTLQALEEIRGGILSGRRVELPSAQRQHLEKGSPLISEVTFDARHRPVSTNVSRHFQSQRVIAPNLEVRHHAFLTLKRSTPGSAKTSVPALLVIVDAESKLSIYSLDNEPLLDKFDLGHGAGRNIVQLEMSPTQENHFIVTVDDDGNIRVHNIKIVAKKQKAEGGKDKDEAEEEPKAKGKDPKEARTLNVTASLASSFTLSPGALAEARKLTVVVPIERGSQTFFVAGDSLGGLSVFFRNGTMRGRVRVTEDPGGVKGLVRGQGQQQVLFYSSHAFGFFSPSQVDLQYAPCTGWNSPLVDLAMEPGYSTGRVLLALQDGDVLVYATTRGKSKACDLALKFPHVSVLPFKLHSFRGHVMALPTPPDDMEKKDEYVREIFFFNVAAMENGYGSAPSRAITLQASFKPKQPENLALLGQPTAGPGAQGGGGEKAKSQIAIRFKDMRGVEVFDLTLRTPPPPKAAQAEGGGSSNGWDLSSIMSWFPKIGVFGIALIGVIFWNIKKVTGGGGGGGGGANDLPTDDFD